NYETATKKDGNHTEKFNGVKTDFVIKSLGYTGWKIVGVTPQSSVILGSFKSNVFVLFMACFFLTALTIIYSYISKRVSAPILSLEQSVKKLEDGNWDTDIEISGFYEVRHLGNAIKNMALQIQKLLVDIVNEHEAKRKSDLSVLQNQINPHFLYNTLDVIVWMIENEKQSEAVKAVTALARFFRISLSKGNNIITVADEIEHVRNYLTIQDMRFKNRFTYNFQIQEEALQLGTIKLVLQPLVENAIYHAMEFMDGDGVIEIKVFQEQHKLKMVVKDNGCGMTEDVVKKLLDGEEFPSGRGSGVGVRNVQERIKLLFGESYGLEIFSEPDEGTEITIIIPATPYETLRKGGAN
ncbi:MAG: sensor histidine kinase, partial [Anaerotignaceae bacterium]